MKRITQTNEIQTGDNSGIVFSGNEKASYSDSYPIESFQDNDLITKQAAEALISSNNPPVSIMPWLPDSPTDSDEYRSHVVDDIEYLFRSNEDGNTTEPDLNSGDQGAWTMRNDYGSISLYNSGTTYNSGDLMRSLNTASAPVFESLSSGNIGNTPPSAGVSDANWKYIGTYQASWSSSVTYQLNDVVYESGSTPDRRRYVSNRNSNTAPLSDHAVGSKWQLVGIKPLDYTAENVANKAIDFTTSNDTLYPSVKAVKTYADALVYGLLNDRGNWDASGNTFPNTGGSGASGAIMKGNLWYISVAGTLGGQAVNVGDWVRALVDSPAQTSTNWSIAESNLGFVPENSANKQNSLTTDGTGIKYPTVDAINLVGNGLIHTTGNETKNGRLTLTSPNGTNGTSPTNAVSALTVTGGDGGINTSTTGFAQGASATSMILKAGRGGASLTSSGTKIGGTGGNIELIAGDAGAGGTSGNAGSAILQGGSIGAGSTNSGIPGRAFIKAGQNDLPGGDGGNIHLVPGYGNNGLAGSLPDFTYDGNTYLGINDNGNMRGAIIMGTLTSDGVNLFQVTGNSKFTGDVTATGNFIGDLTGNATTATTASNWKGLVPNDNFATIQNGTIAAILGRDTNLGAYLYSATALRDFIGIPSGGETLQSVWNRGPKINAATNVNLVIGVGANPAAMALSAVNDASNANTPLELRGSYINLAPGNVGVDYTTDQGYKFAVNGTGKFAGQLNMPSGIDILFGSTGGFGIGQYFDVASNNIKFYNATGGADLLVLNRTTGNLTVSGDVTGANLSGTNTGDQDLSGYAPLASPTFTGTVTAPLATIGSTTIGGSTSNIQAGSGNITIRPSTGGGYVNFQNSTATLSHGFVDSNGWNGNAILAAASTAITHSVGDNSIKIATTAYADRIAIGVKYTPTLSASSNISSSTIQTFYYTRIGNIVRVTGSVTVTPTVAGSFNFKLTLPIASDLSANTDLVGMSQSNSPSTGSYEGNITGDSTNNLAVILSTMSLSAGLCTVDFTYEIK